MLMHFRLRQDLLSFCKHIIYKAKFCNVKETMRMKLGTIQKILAKTEEFAPKGQKVSKCMHGFSSHPLFLS